MHAKYYCTLCTTHAKNISFKVFHFAFQKYQKKNHSRTKECKENNFKLTKSLNYQFEILTNSKLNTAL